MGCSVLYISGTSLHFIASLYVIQVPFCPKSELSGIDDRDFMAAVWYRRSFTLTKAQTVGRVVLHSGAVDYLATVAVNGTVCGSHNGGYVSFFFDITDLVHEGENVVTVRARDNSRDPMIPHGKQSDRYAFYDCPYTEIWQGDPGTGTGIFSHGAIRGLVPSAGSWYNKEKRNFSDEKGETPMSCGIDFRLFHSMEKVFLTGDPGPGNYRTGSFFQNEIYSCQVAYRSAEPIWGKYNCSLELESPIKDDIDIRKVGHVPSHFPAYGPDCADYLTTTPGLFPDVLEPLDRPEVYLSSNVWQTLWILVDPKGEAAPGTYPVRLTLRDPEHGVEGSVTFSVRLLPGELPRQELIHTEWFHADCVAQVHHVPVFSEAHWGILARYIRLGVKYGLTMLYTPVFTPPLDTEVGHYRETVQLVDVECLPEGGYAFGFDRFHRWVRMALDCGIRYLEISHLFTQWGAEHAPKILGKVQGQERQIFGWDTDAASPEYRDFLRAFLHALDGEIRRLGIRDRVYFHVSDEPDMDHLGAYAAAAELVRSCVGEYPVIDALSDYAFYEKGLVEHPIPASTAMEPFLEHGVPHLWTYYCCAQHSQVSNRFMAMPSYRNRILGVQLYWFGIEGLLHWGYNFYNSGLSKRHIDPYFCTDADMAFPSGDPFLVYPYKDGAIESIRQVVLNEGFQDLRALQLLERRRGREYVRKLLKESWEGELTFRNYPRRAAYLTGLRERINQEIIISAEAIGGSDNDGSIDQIG